jgi:hypothetical protein
MHDQSDAESIRTAVPAPTLVALSALLWAIAVVTLRVAAPLGMFKAAVAIPLLIATVPLVWLTLRLGRRVAGQDVDVLLVAAWLSMPALLLDGLAFSAAPWLYGADEAARRAGAGWLLWFVGVSLALAFYQSSRQGVGRTR